MSIRQSRHGLDWSNMPRPFKVYPDLEPLLLPRDFDTGGRPALQTMLAPGSGDGPLLDLRALARLLFFTAGIVRRKVHRNGEMYFRAAACTGALYHIDVYVLCEALPDLPAGVYHFGPHDFALRRLRAGDHRAALIAASGDVAAVAAAPVTLVLTTTFWRNSWKYQARAYRHAFWDAGTLLANLLAVAAAVELPATPVLGFVDAEVDALVGIDGRQEASIALVPLGRRGSVPPVPPEIASVSAAVLPLSEEEIEYPAILAANAAGAFGSAGEVLAWRARAAVDVPTSSSHPRGAAAPLVVVEPIETVILRRGSARQFPRTPLTRAELGSVLACAVAPIPSELGGEAARVANLYVIVHAVDGLAAGAYVWDGAVEDLQLLRAGDFRDAAGHLDLGQALAADAAINCYWLCDLDAVSARYGERGYRLAQTHAAIAGGRTYLAAYALGLAATGLTFFDDDVTAFFSPHAAGKSVLFLTALGRRVARAPSAPPP